MQKEDFFQNFRNVLSFLHQWEESFIGFLLLSLKPYDWVDSIFSCVVVVGGLWADLIVMHRGGGLVAA